MRVSLMNAPWLRFTRPVLIATALTLALLLALLLWRTFVPSAHAAELLGVPEQYGTEAPSSGSTPYKSSEKEAGS